MASADDYDEDVILPSSPLSQYIHEFETFREEDYNESEEFPVMKNDSFLNSIDIRSKIFYCRQLILDSIHNYLSFIYNIFVPCLIPFEYSALKNILEVARCSKVLISEDLSILLNYESDDESNAEMKLSNSSVIQQCFQLFAFVMIFMILRSITITNIITNEDLLSFFSGKSYFVYILLQIFILIISIALYINIFIISIFIVANLLELLLCKALCHSMKKKLHTSGCLLVMIRKCIRLIQEAELIARGFTSASVPGIVERLEISAGLPITSPKRQYPELRRCVFMWTRQMFMLYKNSTQILIESKKIGPVLDFSSQSFAMLDLKEFGNLLKYDINFDDDLQELLKVTDGLSVSSLKTMYLLLELQVSEFYKYLYLIISFLISDDSLFSCGQKLSYFHRLNSYVKSLQTEDMYVWKKSCETHKYYKSIEAQSDIEDKTLAVKRPNASHLEIGVHNMSLHMKAALKRLSEFEDLLDTEKQSNNDFSTQNYVKKMEEMMKEIKSEIGAFHDCMDKCNSELQIILYGDVESPIPLTEKKIAKEDEVLKAPIITKCDSDPVIEDEIFEAIVTKSSHDKENYSDDFLVVKQKQDVEVTGKLLNELKNILVLKADEHRIREEKAMAKKVNKGEPLIDKNSSLDSISDPETDSDAIDPNSKFKEQSKVKLPDTDFLKNLNCDKDEVELTSDTDSEVKTQTEFLDKKNSFAASIAALALQRQAKLGIVDDICFSDSNESDDEVLSN